MVIDYRVKECLTPEGNPTGKWDVESRINKGQWNIDPCSVDKPFDSKQDAEDWIKSDSGEGN